MTNTPKTDKRQPPPLRLCCDFCRRGFSDCRCNPEKWIGTTQQRRARANEIKQIKFEARKAITAKHSSKPRAHHQHVWMRLPYETIETLRMMGQMEGRRVASRWTPRSSSVDRFLNLGVALALHYYHGTASALPAKGAPTERVRVRLSAESLKHARLVAPLRQQDPKDTLREEIIRGAARAVEDYETGRADVFARQDPA